MPCLPLRRALARSVGRAWAAMTPFYIAGALLVIAQALGVYALITRKADLIFSLVMIALVVGALVSGADGAYNELPHL
ncbi:MAG TPA: hypothetical protein VME46_02365 [Acidimicrobiales bacterium]|nr:hypothetical protein [Acidimicrobiales bacterium]